MIKYAKHGHVRYAGVGAWQIRPGGGMSDTPGRGTSLMDFKGCIQGKSHIFEKSRSANGVAVRDGELILWGMKAMPYILYLDVLNHIKTLILELNCLYIPKFL